MNKPNNGVWLNNYKKFWQSLPEFSDTRFNIRWPGFWDWHKYMSRLDWWWFGKFVGWIWLGLSLICLCCRTGVAQELASFSAGAAFSIIFWVIPTIKSEKMQQDLLRLDIGVELVELLMKKLDNLLSERELFDKKKLQLLLDVCNFIELYMTGFDTKFLVACCGKVSSDTSCSVSGFAHCLQQFVNDESFVCDKDVFGAVATNCRLLHNELSKLRDKLMQIKMYIAFCHKADSKH